MRFAWLLFAAGITTLAGCAVGPTPQNAAEFRQSALRGDYGVIHESYEVNNSYAKVAATLKAKANECFNATLSEKECQGTNCIGRQYNLTSHFNNNGKAAELSVQTKMGHDAVFLGGPPPASGLYLSVADAEDLGSGKTRMTVYGPSIGMFAHIPKAIKQWAHGTNLGCPDFAADL